jgi:single-strand DNA-binding protein
MQESHIQVTGNLCADPILRVVGNGTPVSNFRIANTPRWRDRESGVWRDGTTTFFNVSCWRALAENVTASLVKGDKVVVIGRLRQRDFVTSAGVERMSLEIDADLVGPDLNRQTANVRKAQRPAPPAVGGPAAAPQPEAATAAAGRAVAVA